jgi:hypothetical protein
VSVRFTAARPLRTVSGFVVGGGAGLKMEILWSQIEIWKEKHQFVTKGCF